jgi:hypothetical protein
MTTPNLPPRSTYGSSLRPIEERDMTGYGSAFDIDGDDLGLEGDEYGDYELGLGDRFRGLIGRGLVRLGWLALAAGLAFGSAGIVAAAQHAPSSGNRPELTWGADQVMSDKLDAAIRDLARLKDDVDSLGQMTRSTLSSLAQVNQPALQKAWDEGWNNVVAIDAGAADLNDRLQCSAWESSLQTDLIKKYSPALVDRYHRVCQALGSVSPLRDDWQSVVNGSQTAIRVANDIETHDSTAGDALQLATEGRFPEAITKIDSAAADIDDATSVAETLAKVTDVSTLTEWLSRTKNMDDALRLLWQTMIASKGQVTIQVTAALRDVNTAKALLPNSSDVLQVVLYEMAGNLTSDGISIETARGALADALSGLVGGAVIGG